MPRLRNSYETPKCLKTLIRWVCRQEAVSWTRLFVFLRRGSRGGVAAGSSSGQTGKKYRLRLLLKGESYCLKDIGDGATFCLRENCVVKHSGIQRVSLYSGNGLFVIGKSKDTAFSSPVLGQNEVANEVWAEDSEDSSKSLEE